MGSKYLGRRVQIHKPGTSVHMRSGRIAEHSGESYLVYLDGGGSQIVTDDEFLLVEEVPEIPEQTHRAAAIAAGLEASVAVAQSANAAETLRFFLIGLQANLSRMIPIAEEQGRPEIAAEMRTLLESSGALIPHLLLYTGSVEDVLHGALARMNPIPDTPEGLIDG